MPTQAPPVAAAAAAEEDQKRPSALMKKIKSLVPYALSRSFGGCINRRSGMAVVGVHVGLCILYLSRSCQWICFGMLDPEVTRLWNLFFLVLAYVLVAVCVLDWGHGICLYVMYSVRDDPPKQNSAAAAEVLLLPPPPPEMDMC